MRGHFEGTAGNGKCLRPPEKSSGILAGEVETFSSKRRSFGNLDREISEYAGHDSFSPPKPRTKSPSDLPLGEYNFKHRSTIDWTYTYKRQSVFQVLNNRKIMYSPNRLFLF